MAKRNVQSRLVLVRQATRLGETRKCLSRGEGETLLRLTKQTAIFEHASSERMSGEECNGAFYDIDEERKLRRN